MKVRLLLSVYCNDDFRGQCFPEITVKDWDELEKLITPQGRDRSALDWSLRSVLRDIVIKTSGIDSVEHPNKVPKLTALIVQIILV